MPLNLTEDKNVYGVIRIVILATDDLNKVVSLLQLFLHIYSFSHLFIAPRCLSFTEDNTKTIWCVFRGSQGSMKWTHAPQSVPTY